MHMGMPQKKLKPIGASRRSIDKQDRLFQEINLLNLEALMFCTSKSERQRIKSEIQTENDDIVTLTRENKNGDQVQISFDCRYGAPAGLAYRILQAGLFKLTQQGKVCDANNVCSFPHRISFGYRELARLSGRKWCGSKEANREFYNAIMQLYRTDFRISWHDKSSGRHAELNLHPFISAYFSSRGGSSADDEGACMFQTPP